MATPTTAANEDGLLDIDTILEGMPEIDRAIFGAAMGAMEKMDTDVASFDLVKMLPALTPLFGDREPTLDDAHEALNRLQSVTIGDMTGDGGTFCAPLLALVAYIERDGKAVEVVLFAPRRMAPS